jgi:uncharacterized membrane protein
MSPKVEKDTTVFIFKVTNLQLKPFFIRDRYSGIRKLYETLKKREPNFKKNFNVEFPAKNLFAEDFINKRNEGL